MIRYAKVSTQSYQARPFSCHAGSCGWCTLKHDSAHNFPFGERTIWLDSLVSIVTLSLLHKASFHLQTPSQFQASISHNTLNSGCLYVSTVTSQWKIGGFEAASLHKKMDAKVK